MIPVNIVTGQLGAGKTTIILNLIEKLKRSKIVWLKNEYGDINIDSEVAKSKNIFTKEIVNGCLCCVLIGKLGEALDEISKKYKPDRVIIETAGTAHPYPIVREVVGLKEFFVDSVVMVVDAKNYKSTEKNFLSRKQANFFNLIVINKVSLIDDDRLYEVIEDINDVYYRIPQVLTKDGDIPVDLAIDINVDKKNKYDPKIFLEDDVHEDIETFSFIFHDTIFNLDGFKNFLVSLNKNKYWRVKGILNFDSEFYVVNYAYGDYTITQIENYSGDSKIIFMGKNIIEQKNNVYNLLKSCIK